jgi:predicted DNA-binding transcriptional regulator AlpA
VKNTTLDIISATLKTDDTISAAERARIAAILRRNDKPVQQQQRSKAPALMRRRQVAEMLSCSLRSVDNYAAQGILQKVKFPGRVRGSGFRRSDVEALIGAVE